MGSVPIEDVEGLLHEWAEKASEDLFQNYHEAENERKILFLISCIRRLRKGEPI